MKHVFLIRGAKDVSIVVPRDPAPVELTAARELTEYLQKSLDAALPTVKEGEEKGVCIYVGQTDYARAAGVVGKEKEHWIIRMHEGNLILTGGKEKGERGIGYAVYHFLEELVGVRWWSAYEEDVLTLDALSLEDDLFREGIPAFPFRKPYMDSHGGADAFPHIPRTRTNILSPYDDEMEEKSVYDPIIRAYGDISYMGRPHHVHVMGQLFPAKETYAAHPEWFAWNVQRGKHIPEGHFCLKNEAFLDAIVEKYDAILAEDAALAEKTGVELPYFYSTSLDDKAYEFSFCQCEQCAAAIERSGISGYVVQFTNAVARRLKKKYPFARFETLAYVCYIRPPKDDTVPDGNVVIRLAPCYADILHSINSPTNREFLDVLSGWSRCCAVNGAHLLIWQYLYNQEINYPLPLFYPLPDTLRTFRKYGVKGIFSETQNSVVDGWLLNRRMLTHLLEDPDLDEEALITDFCYRYYGDAAGPHVKAYFDLLCASAERNPVHVYMSHEDSTFSYVDSTLVIEGSRLLDLACEAIGEEEPFRRRFHWLRKPLDGVILSKYFDLKRQAERRGERFDFDHALLKARVKEALTEHLSFPGPQRVTRIEDELAYYDGLSDKEEQFPIPACLKDADPDDVYQVAVKDMPRFGEAWIRKYFCFSLVEDECSPISRVLKIEPDRAATSSGAGYWMYPTSQKAEKPEPIRFFLLQKGEKVSSLALYLEDLPKEVYGIYKVGSLKNVRTVYDSRFCPFETGLFTLNLTGLSAVFPMEDCDVYISMRYEGEKYGGAPGTPNAAYVDRVIIHRTR